MISIHFAENQTIRHTSCNKNLKLKTPYHTAGNAYYSALPTRLGTAPSGVRISVEARDFSLLKNVQYQLWGRPILLFNGYRSSFRRQSDVNP